jgi:hypothetical protein
MADTPSNQKLYAMVVMQAKAKYRVYPSPGASHWVHKRYLELGGKFVDPVVEHERKKVIQRMIEAREGHDDSDDRDRHMKHRGHRLDKKH